MSDSICLYQSVSFSAPLLFVDCVSSQSVPLSSLLLPLPASTVILQHISLRSIHYLWYTALFQCLNRHFCWVRCHAVMIHWHRRVILGIIFLLARVIAHFPPKIHSPTIFFILLWGACSLQYFIPTFLRCPAGMTTWSVCMEHHI